jgi:hypothetical protein
LYICAGIAEDYIVIPCCRAGLQTLCYGAETFFAWDSASLASLQDILVTCSANNLDSECIITETRRFFETKIRKNIERIVNAVAINVLREIYR